MEDDDIAHSAQLLLDSIDNFLRNPKVLQELSQDDVNAIRIRRSVVAYNLKTYRDQLGYTRRRQAGRQLPSPVRIRLAAILAGAAPIGLRTGLGLTATGEGASLVLGEVGMVLAVALYFTQLTDGPGQMTASDFARYLNGSVNLLMSDLLELDALTTLLAITAAEAAALSTKELMDELIRAINSMAGSAMAILFAELLRRFPGCAAVIQKAQSKARERFRKNKNPSLRSSRWVEEELKLIAEISAALKAVVDCFTAKIRPAQNR